MKNYFEFPVTHKTYCGCVNMIVTPREIYIDLVNVYTGFRRKGAARAMMADVIAFAELARLPMRLHAVGFGIPEDALIAFFESLGFVMSTPRPWSNEMKRP